MNHSTQLFLPEPAELLFKAGRPHQLCCFAALTARRRRNKTMTDVADDSEANESALVYRPQSMLFPSSPNLSIASSCSAAAAAAAAAPSPRSMPFAEGSEGESQLTSTAEAFMATVTPRASGRLQLMSSPSRYSIDTSSLPSLVSSLLRWRTSSPATAGAIETIDRVPRRQCRRMHQLERQQCRTWDGSGDSRGPVETAVVAAESPEEASQAGSSDSAADAADNEAVADITDRFNGHSDVCSDDDSSIVEMYLDSILEILPDEADSDVPDSVEGVACRVASDSANIDELLRLAEAANGEYITDAADAEVTAGSELVEVARGVEFSSSADDKDVVRKAETATATMTTPTAAGVAYPDGRWRLSAADDKGVARKAETVKATMTTPTAVGVDYPDGGRRLSATGSEPATDEFNFIRVRVLPTAPSTSITAVTTPRLCRAATMAPPQPQPPPPPQMNFLPEAAIATVGNSRRRFHKRRQSYILNGRHCEESLSSNAVVLTGARHGLGTPTQPLQKQQLPPFSTARYSATPVRAVIFHPPSQASRAAYLANYLASSGQPANLWSAESTESQDAEPQAGEKRSQLAARLRAGIFRRSSRSQSAVSRPTDVLAACARRGHLPIVLLPACGSTDDRFMRRLRESLTGLPPLPAGMIVVVAGPSEASHWAAAAGADTPTQVVRDESVAANDAGQEGCRRSRLQPLGPECCRQVLAAARRSGTLASTYCLL